MAGLPTTAGTHAALQSSRPNNVDYGDIASNLQESFRRDRQEALQNEEIKRRRLNDLEDRFGINEDDYVLEGTEFRTVNDAATESVSLLRDEYYNTYKQLQADPTNIELKKKLGKLSNGAKSLKQTNEKFKEIGEQYVTALGEDQISGVDETEWKERLEAYDEGRVKTKLDENGDLNYLFYDKDGSFSDAVSFNDFVKGSLIKKVDIGSEADAFLESIGSTKKDEVTGAFIKTEDVFGARQREQASELVTGFLDSDDIVADVLNQMNGSRQRSDFTEDQKIQAHNYLVEQIENRYDETISLKNRPIRQPRAKTASELKQPSTSKLNVATDNGGALLRNGNVVFTYAGGLQIDPNKTDRAIDRIQMSPDGQITLFGQDKIKIKGVEGETDAQKVAKKENITLADLIEETDGNKVTYYKKEPITLKGEVAINKLGNILKVSDEQGLRQVLLDKLAEKFGQENVDSFLRGEITNAEGTQNSEIGILD